MRKRSEAKAELLAARKRLLNPGTRWVQESPGPGEECLESAIVRWRCAIITKATVLALGTVSHVITKRYGSRVPIPAWNDMEGRTFAEVIDVLTEAIAIVDEVNLDFSDGYLVAAQNAMTVSAGAGIVSWLMQEPTAEDAPQQRKKTAALHKELEPA